MEKSGIYKIKNWFSKKENLIIFSVLFVTLLIRIYYFILTKDQPLWWDEADYMNIGKSWAGLYTWDFTPLRPILFPLIFLGLLKIGLGELTMRILVIFSSLIAIFFLFKLGELFFNKWVGLLSAFFLASFWSFSFYSYRLLVDVPLVSLAILTVYTFFYSYFNNKNWRYYLLPGIFLGLSFLMKPSALILVFLIAIYLGVTERKNTFTNVNNYIFYGASFLTILPYLFWQKIYFGSFFASYTSARGGIVSQSHTFFESLFDQTIFSFKVLDSSLLNPSQFFFPFLVLSTLIGIFLILYRMLFYEKIFEKKSIQNIGFFLLLWMIFGLLFFGWNNYGNYMEERYYFLFYPSLFLFAGYTLQFLYKKFESKKIIALVVLIVLLGIFSYQQISHSNEIITNKIDSYTQLKEAGLFIKENTLSGENFTTTEEMAELVYYSERKSNPEGSIRNISHLFEIIERDHSEYLIFSNYYYLTVNDNGQHIEVLKKVFNDKENFTLIKYYRPMIDQQGTIPLVSIFKINY